MVTDAFVGVCCSSLKKICGIFKRHILNDGESIPRVRRNTTYDARVEPLYWLYPHNAVACHLITRGYWNPYAEAVKRWVELCRPEGWAHRGFTRLICLDPIDIQQDDLTLDMLRIYTHTIGTQLQQMAAAT